MSSRKKNIKRPNRRRRLRIFPLLIISILCVVAVNINNVQSIKKMFNKPYNAFIGAVRKWRNETTGQQNDAANSSWMLVLVNKDNPLPDDYTLKMKSLTNGLKFDERAINNLNDMLAAARNQGLSPVVCSAYRNIESQRSLFNDKVDSLVASGMNLEQATKEAKSHVAFPGTSEHGLGLAADIVSLDYQLLNDKQADTPEAKWLLEHCAEYGFILRYPKGKEDITGVIYEPWHFRYVGAEAAKEIMENSYCLEEYLNRNLLIK